GSGGVYAILRRAHGLFHDSTLYPMYRRVSENGHGAHDEVSTQSARGDPRHLGPRGGWLYAQAPGVGGLDNYTRSVTHRPRPTGVLVLRCLDNYSGGMTQSPTLTRGQQVKL